VHRGADRRARCHNDVVIIAPQAFEADRMVVIGCAGSGKSTLAAGARRAARCVPHPAGLAGPRGQRPVRRAIAGAVSGDRWVFDGAPSYVEELLSTSAEDVSNLLNDRVADIRACRTPSNGWAAGGTWLDSEVVGTSSATQRQFAASSSA